MLPVHVATLWNAYSDSEANRVRQESLNLLRRFIESLGEVDPAIVTRWAIAFASASVAGTDKTPIRMPLFRDVLFPALVIGYKNADVESIWLLSQFEQVLYKSPECWQTLPENERTEHGLLLKLFRIQPSDVRVRSRLVEILADRFGYYLHELPVGVLYGQNGASTDECVDILNELKFFEELVAQAERSDMADLISRTRMNVTSYREYLLTRKNGDTFAGFVRSKAT